MDSQENSNITLNNSIISGSILSQNVRNNIVNSNSAVSPIGIDNLTVIQNRQKQLDIESSAALVEQQNIFNNFNSGIQNLRADIGKLNTGLSGIALLLQQDAAEDQSRILAEQEKERRLTEQEIRIGKESQIEQKIQNAITEPAEKLVPRVNDLFGGIGNALKILFMGWITNEAVTSIASYQQKNIGLFANIKGSVLKNLGILAGGLIALKTGFSLIKRKMGEITSGLLRLFIPRPSLGNKGGGLLGTAGKFVTFLSGYLNWQNKEYTDSILAAMSAASILPGPLGLIGKIAGMAFTADEISEAFGKNIFGDERDNKVNEIAKKFMGQTSEAKPTPASETPQTPPGAAKTAPEQAAPSSPASPPPAASEPQQTLMGQRPTTNTMPALTPERISQFEQAWKYRNNPLARGRIEGAWSKLSPEQQNQAKEWAKSKGYDWSEMRLSDSSTPKVPMTGQTTNSIPTSTDRSQETPTIPVPISPPPNISSIPKEAQQVGQLPEPNPKITMIAPFTRSNQQQQQIPLTNGALTDVPLISSSNPDNFYVLYSQLNYNVVT